MVQRLDKKTVRQETTMTRHETVGEKVHLSFEFEDAEDLNEDEESRKVKDSDQTRKNLMK